MSAPAATYYFKISGGNFWVSGEGANSWTDEHIDGLSWFPNCPEKNEIYKFDISHSSFVGNQLKFSDTLDGNHGSFSALIMGGAQGFSGCGVPGLQGSSVKFNAWTYQDYFSTQSELPPDTIYPFCPQLAGAGGGGYYMVVENDTHDDCVDRDYACETCSLETSMSGAFSTLSGEVKTELDNTYDPYQVTGYSIETGVEYGSYPMCEMVATGTSQAESEAMLTGELAPLFHNSGFCVDRATLVTGFLNVNNISLSYNFPYSYQSDGIWQTRVTGFSDRRHRVIYTPQISGQRTSVSVDVNCPETQLQVSLERDVQLWDTTGTATKPDLSESGYKTTLTADCVKIRGGTVSLCEKTFVYNGQNITGCWEEHCDKGNYGVVYKTGSFENDSDKHIIGTGVLSAEKLI
jgi:hypothetical protein